MQDTPNPVDLLQAVAGFLRDTAMPQLSGHAAFHARVAANTLDIVIRQLQTTHVDEPAEILRLQALLGPQAQAGDEGAASPPEEHKPPVTASMGAGAAPSPELVALNRELCDRIAQRTLTLNDPALVDHLWKTTMEKLSVDQPRYETYRRMLEATQPR